VIKLPFWRDRSPEEIQAFLEISERGLSQGDLRLTMPDLWIRLHRSVYGPPPDQFLTA
jgi:hypothetical protein